MLDIIIPAKSTALTTLGAVMDELGSEANHGLVLALIDRASATIESVCSRRFAVERVRETFADTSGPILARWPVRELHAVTVDGETQDAGAYASTHGILSRRDGRPWRRARAVIVEYTAGYRLPDEEERDLPHDVERVAIELVKFDWHTATRDPSVRSESVDGVSTLQFFGSGSSINAITAPLAAYRMQIVV